MIVVLDASAAISVVLARKEGEIFHPLLEEAELVVAPELYVAEICNALWKYRKADMLSLEQCEKAIEQALGLPDRFVTAYDLHREAFGLAVRHAHPVYDALYLVLARRNNAVLLTLDSRLAKLAEELEISLSPSPSGGGPGRGI